MNSLAISSITLGILFWLLMAVGVTWLLGQVVDRAANNDEDEDNQPTTQSGEDRSEKLL